MYQRIVVPLDGSEIAERALVEAGQMATLVRAPVHLVRVVDLSSHEGMAIASMVGDAAAVSAMMADEYEAAEQYLAIIAERLRAQRLTVSYEVRRGAVAGELIAVAAPGDLYVMASHGRSGIARWFLGSVAEEVVRRSLVPVLLVRTTSAAIAPSEQNGRRSRLEALVPTRRAPATTPEMVG